MAKRLPTTLPVDDPLVTLMGMLLALHGHIVIDAALKTARRDLGVLVRARAIDVVNGFYQ